MRRVGQRPGDVRVRRGRRRTAIIDVVVRRRRPMRLRLWMVPAAFAAAILLGAGLLSLPFATESGEWTRGSVALFTSASAICVTGLVRVDTADHWSAFGEVVIALLIQAGGLGVTMYAGALLLVLGRRFGLSERQFFGIELEDVAVHDVRVLLRRVMRFVIVVRGGDVPPAAPVVSRRGRPAGGRLAGGLPRDLGLQQRGVRPDGRRAEHGGARRKRLPARRDGHLGVRREPLLHHRAQPEARPRPLVARHPGWSPTGWAGSCSWGWLSCSQASSPRAACWRVRAWCRRSPTPSSSR